MPFGIAPAPEEFQRRLNHALEGLDGVRTIADDIILYGEGDTENYAVVDHDRKFLALLECCRQEHVEMNKDKDSSNSLSCPMLAMLFQRKD